MAQQEKSRAACLEILQDYTAKDFSLFAVLTTADFIATTRSSIFIAQSKRHETVARHPFMSQ